MLQVSPATAPVRRGECYVRVTLLMGGFAVGRLIAGYVTDGQTLAWPGGEFENFTDGSGLMRSIAGTNPAAGVNISETVPTNARWRVKSVYVVLVTGAAVADRYIFLQTSDGTNDMLSLPTGVTQTASQTNLWVFAVGVQYLTAAVASTITTPIPPDLILFQGSVLKTSVGNFQAGDDWGTPRFQVEEWIEE